MIYDWTPVKPGIKQCFPDPDHRLLICKLPYQKGAFFDLSLTGVIRAQREIVTISCGRIDWGIWTDIELMLDLARQSAETAYEEIDNWRFQKFTLSELIGIREAAVRLLKQVDFGDRDRNLGRRISQFRSATPDAWLAALEGEAGAWDFLRSHRLQGGTDG